MAKDIKIDVTIKSSIDKVWQCYTEPQHIVGWNFASDDWHCPKAENDLRPGGIYAARMEAKDGSFGFDFNGVYDEVVPFKKIVYTLEDGRKVMTSFEETGDGVTVTTVFEAENMNPADMQQAGWQAILNNFKNYVTLKS